MSESEVTVRDIYPTIYHNSHPKGTLPPPWYRAPPGVEKGRKRIRASIIGGLVIDNEEGRRWFKDFFNFQLADHHRQDMNVSIRLVPLLASKNIKVFDSCPVPRRLESGVDDFLVITHIARGPFIHDGPDGYEEVLDEDRKPLPGVKEEEVKAQLKKEFGIETCGYKSYYSNIY